MTRVVDNTSAEALWSEWERLRDVSSELSERANVKMDEFHSVDLANRELFDRKLSEYEAARREQRTVSARMDVVFARYQVARHDLIEADVFG